ncbi:MAG: hydrogenase 3 maturation endopeptidase HyCI [Anaerolineaceae bacterium]|nr:hydrogenase 3 maturation endopeptidase HyCI [Anaerolineaceae bacterium]
MSNFSWKEKLIQTLQNLALRDDPGGQVSPPPRLVVIGIGNELNGDDAAGVLVIRSLQRFLSTNPQTLLVEAGPSPESFTGPIRRFQPDMVLLVDAVDMGEEPGSIAWVEWQRLSGVSALTHRLPPTVFGKFLIQEIQCQLALLGIQAGSVEFGAPLSPAVKNAIRRLTNGLAAVLKELPGF